MLFILVATGLISNFAFAGNDEAMKNTRSIIKRDYLSCRYTDSLGQLTKAQIFQMPVVSCGVSLAAKIPKAICETNVTCAAATKPDVTFKTRCYSMDGKTCPTAIECRDGDGLEVYDSIEEIAGKLVIEQKGVSSGTSK